MGELGFQVSAACFRAKTWKQIGSMLSLAVQRSGIEQLKHTTTFPHDPMYTEYILMVTNIDHARKERVSFSYIFFGRVVLCVS